MSVLLVRHGATEWSEDGRHTSTTDLALTAQGERDADALRPVLAVRSFAVVASSPRARALDTCRRAGLEEKVQVWDDLVEWDYGEYEGITTPDIQAGRPGWELFRDGCPGGESPADVAARADAVVARVRALATDTDGDVALFSHGHFLRVFAARWVGWPVEAGLHLLLDTGTLSELDAKRGDPVIRRWNAPVA